MPAKLHTIRVDSDDSDEEFDEYIYILSQRTIRAMPMFIRAVNPSFEALALGWTTFEANDVDPLALNVCSEAYLIEELCSGDSLDISKIMSLLSHRENHLHVMSALACIEDFHLDLVEVEDSLKSECELKAFKRLWKSLPRWREFSTHDDFM